MSDLKVQLGFEVYRIHSENDILENAYIKDILKKLSEKYGSKAAGSMFLLYTDSDSVVKLKHKNKAGSVEVRFEVHDETSIEAHIIVISETETEHGVGCVFTWHIDAADSDMSSDIISSEISELLAAYFQLGVSKFVSAGRQIASGHSRQIHTRRFCAVKEVSYSIAYELVMDFEYFIDREFMLEGKALGIDKQYTRFTEDDFEGYLKENLGGDFYVTPVSIVYSISPEELKKPAETFIDRLFETKLEKGWWVADCTGHTGDMLLRWYSTKADAMAHLYEMRLNPYCTYLQVYHLGGSVCGI